MKAKIVHSEHFTKYLLVDVCKKKFRQHNFLSAEDICWIYVEYNFFKSNPIYCGYNFLFPKSSYTKKIVKISQPQNFLYNIKKFYHPSVLCKINYRHSLKCFKIKIWGLGIEKPDFLCDFLMHRIGR